MMLPPGEARQPGGSGGGTDRTRITIENRSEVTISAGMLVQCHASGVGLDLHDGSRRSLGFAVADIQPGLSGEVQSAGFLTLSWTLRPGARYFADPVVPGGITWIPPATSGTFSQAVGVAASTSTLEINLGPRIQL